MRYQRLRVIRVTLTRSYLAGTESGPIYKRCRSAFPRCDWIGLWPKLEARWQRQIGPIHLLLQRQSLLVRGIRELHIRIKACDGLEGNLPTSYISVQPQIQDHHESFGMSVRKDDSQDIIFFADGAYCDTNAQVEQLGVEVSANLKYLPPISPGDRQAMSSLIHASSGQSSSAYGQTEPYSASKIDESFSINSYTLDKGQSNKCFQASGAAKHLCRFSPLVFVIKLLQGCSRPT